MNTTFAPAGRLCNDEIRHQAQHMRQSPTVSRQVSDVGPNMVIVVNQQRQIVFGNTQFFRFVGLPESQCLGQRPGEALGCEHALDSEGGCGTSVFCSTCGAVRAILSALRGEEDVQECRLTRKDTHEALDLRVWTHPIEVQHATYVVFVVQDITHEKRRQALEQIFFHDLLNTATAITGYAQTLALAAPDEVDTYRQRVARLSRRLADEIEQQRDLAAAERFEYAPQLQRVRSRALLQEVAQAAVHGSHEARALAPDCVDLELETDPTLLRRVLGNMLKNALEAGGSVRLGCRPVPEGICFWVHNPSVMPPEVQLQVFQRSFSTRGPGRGLGTYSMRLLSERYLQGQVSFRSTVEEGTTFFATYPLRPAARGESPSAPSARPAAAGRSPADPESANE